MGTAKTRGQRAYEAYAEAERPWQTFDGRPMPTWQALQTTEAGQVTCRRWEAAADAMVGSTWRLYLMVLCSLLSALFHVFGGR